MKMRNLALSVAVAAAGLSSALVSTAAFAQAKEQFFPSLVYRTGAYAPNGVPFANGMADYMKLVNARGGINGKKLELLVEDDVCKPEVATNTATKLVSQGAKCQG